MKVHFFFFKFFFLVVFSTIVTSFLPVPEGSWKRQLAFVLGKFGIQFLLIVLPKFLVFQNLI